MYSGTVESIGQKSNHFIENLKKLVEVINKM